MIVNSCPPGGARGIPARARCGFATHFARGKHLDHWITEYRHAGERCVRVAGWLESTDMIMQFGRREHAAWGVERHGMSVANDNG
ncbi:hypothetical protein [Nonomuraea sp. NPDC050786]|uniref:hypothetical protein n=1 Tax=Nonomuraea sp. NPDC050786 TaxID=3154840 RepID=UPI0033EFA28A